MSTHAQGPPVVITSESTDKVPANGALRSSFVMRWLGLGFEFAAAWYLLFLILCLSSLTVFDALQARQSEQLRSERFAFFLNDIREKVETDLRIGFSIEQDRGAQSKIDELIRQAPELRSIDIFDLAGKAVASTDRGTVGEMVDPAWLKVVQDARGEIWRYEAGDQIVFGVPVRGPFGELAGEIAVTYPPGHSAWDQGFRFERGALILLVVVLFGGLVAPAWLVRRYARSVEAQEIILGAQEMGQATLDKSDPLLLAKHELIGARAHLLGLQRELDDEQ